MIVKNDLALLADGGSLEEVAIELSAFRQAALAKSGEQPRRLAELVEVSAELATAFERRSELLAEGIGPSQEQVEAVREVFGWFRPSNPDGQFFPCCEIRLAALQYQLALLRTVDVVPVLEKILVREQEDPSPEVIAETLHHEIALREQYARLVTEQYADASEDYQIFARRLNLQIKRKEIDGDRKSIFEWQDYRKIHDAVAARRPDIVELWESLSELGHALAEQNARLALGVARKISQSGGGRFSLEELTGTAYEGLHKGVVRYEVDTGYQLSTYCTWWIQQALSREVEFGGNSVIRFPRGVYDQALRYRELQQRLEKEYITVAELRDHLDLSAEEAEKFLTNIALVRSAASSNRQMEVAATRGGKRIGELVSRLAGAATGPLDSPVIGAEQHEVAALLAGTESLTDRERYTLTHRLGLEGQSRMTLKELGSQLGVTRERIRQIERDGKEKLKRVLTRTRSELRHLTEKRERSVDMLEDEA
ncbi:sigma-70 family RNA polymerase sigma factor [bacterium]|nr:sigma-70 family RNA polymerase sigma factor [bacterium]